MTDDKQKIVIDEICRVEGHSAVEVSIVNGRPESVKLDVFEGSRFFERIVVGHHLTEMPHITSRVCAICSTGHVLAAIFAIEKALEIVPSQQTMLLRELMHLGMIIESHATHIYALAMPDFLGASTLGEFALGHPDKFKSWRELRELGSLIQAEIGGRPFHPVNLHVGGFSHYPDLAVLETRLLSALKGAMETAKLTVNELEGVEPTVSTTTVPCYVALIPSNGSYGFFGNSVTTSAGWSDAIENYEQYLAESVVPYSHAKQSHARGVPMMVGAMARLHLFGSRLTGEAARCFDRSPIKTGAFNPIYNNLAQSIEIVHAIERCIEILALLSAQSKTPNLDAPLIQSSKAGTGVGAVECPRGTLYHSYSFDKAGIITSADLVTPSAQNTRRIEQDVFEVVETYEDPMAPALKNSLETVVRAYDPCNTCATHMVKLVYK